MSHARKPAAQPPERRRVTRALPKRSPAQHPKASPPDVLLPFRSFATAMTGLAQSPRDPRLGLES